MSSSAANAPGDAGSGSGRTWTVPGYTELRPLGGGGFGEVVLAAHDATGTQVAIKYLHPQLLGDPDHVAMFRAEAAVLRELDDPHVVRLYEYVEGPAGAAIVMELVDGISLQNILENQGSTTPEAALVVLFGSLLGLAAAHARGVVHRDYKPANVLVDSRGVSKLTDFGIAALAGDRPVPTGTLRHMPPEQFEGAPASPAADVYAATVTFYECLAGHVPFDGQTVTELYDQHKSAVVPMDPIPEALRPVVARGMAKSPQYRPSDAAQLAAELRDAAVGTYGQDWEDRGRSHLAEAALLLALLWPSGGTSGSSGFTVQHTQLTEPPHPAHPSHDTQLSQNAHPTQASQSDQLAQNAHPARASQAGQPTQDAHPAQAGHSPQAGHPVQDAHQPQLSRAAEHRWHLRHILHLEHLKYLERLRNLGRERTEEGGGDEKPAGRRSRLRSRLRANPRLAVAGGAAVVVAAVVVIVAITSTGHSTPPPAAAGTSGTGAPGTGGVGQAGGGAGGGSQPGGGSGLAATANETAGRVAVVSTGGTITGGPLLGPDGRLWVVTTSPTHKPVLQAVNPTTDAVTTYPLTSSLAGSSVTYTGLAAFDGAGHLWLDAALTNSAGQETTEILLRYTPGTGAIERFPENSGCAAISGDYDEISAASDGAIWVVCDNVQGGGALISRFSPDGAMTQVQIVNTAQPGTTLYLGYEELPEDGVGGPLVPGPAGTMWGLDSGSFIQLSAAGRETLLEGTDPTTPIQILGNGTGTIETLGSCDVNNAQGEHSEQCVNTVNPDGSETTIALAPDYDGYNNNYFVHWAAMDRSGNVWVIMDHMTGGTGPAGQYLWKVSPGGATTVYPFTVPGDAAPVPVVQASPVITPDGGIWTVDTASKYHGALVEVLPKV